MRRRVAKEKLSKGAASGMVALVFLVLGFQSAVFVLKVIERPGDTLPLQAEGADTVSRAAATSSVAVTPNPAPREAGPSPGRTKYGGYAAPPKKYGGASKPAEKPRRSVESFAFDPNIVSLEDLQRLGLSERQAQSIDNYRSKGGRFRSKEDFRKMYVVSDTLYARLEPFIEIPRLELNAADSAALTSLRGIGPYYARKILAYRERLGGFVDVAQLREIEGIDDERFEGLSPQVEADPSRVRRLDLWHAPDSILALHPYLGPRGARSIVRYRDLYDSARWTLHDLARERVLSQENIEKLKKYIANQ